MSIGMLPDGQIAVEGFSLSDKVEELASFFATYFKKLGIESLTISLGMTAEELQSLIIILLMSFLIKFILIFLLIH